MEQQELCQYYMKRTTKSFKRRAYQIQFLILLSLAVQPLKESVLYENTKNKMEIKHNYQLNLEDFNKSIMSLKNKDQIQIRREISEPKPEEPIKEKPKIEKGKPRKPEKVEPEPKEILQLEEKLKKLEIIKRKLIPIEEFEEIRKLEEEFLKITS